MTEDDRASAARAAGRAAGSGKGPQGAAPGAAQEDARGEGRGDATLGRIAELAEGWSVGAAAPSGGAAPTAAEPARRPSLPPPRPGKTAPPPPPRTAETRPSKPAPPPAASAAAPVAARAAVAPPLDPDDSGSIEVPFAVRQPSNSLAAGRPAPAGERLSLERALAEADDEGEDDAADTAAAPAAVRTGRDDEPAARGEVSDDRESPPVSTSASAAGAPAVTSSTSEERAVPVGEFDAPRGGRHALDPRLEPRGDPTMIDASHLRTDQTEIRESRGKVADAGIAATLRHAPALPRRRGLWGDLRYVFTVWLGVRRARRELVVREREQLEREQTRRRHLTSIGRTAATAAALDQTQIRRARDVLSTIADDRDKHAAQVGDCDAEMEAVRRQRLAKAESHRAEIEALEEELSQLQGKLEPLMREAAMARRKATDLRNTLIKLDGRIRNVEAGRGKWAEQASQAAELAALRAERQGVARDEPIIAAQLDSLVPRIASIEASRERLRRKITERNEEEEEDRKRSDELLSAIGAKRKVVERATGDAEKARERMLAELGERLYVDRPADLAAQLSPIDGLDLELGDGQRRIMELKEILGSVDRWKLARGILWWTLIAAALGALTWLYLQGQLPLIPPP